MPPSDQIVETTDEQDKPVETTDVTTQPGPAAQVSTETVDDLKKQLARLQEDNTKYQKLLKERNAEEAARRKKLEALEAAEAEKAEASKTEIEKLQGKYAKLEAEADELRLVKRRTLAEKLIALAVEKAKLEFAGLNARQVAFDLLLRDKEIGEDGTIEALDDAVKNLPTEHDYLFKREAVPAEKPKPPVTNASERGPVTEEPISDERRRELANRFGVRPEHVRPT